jgi:hypothetical protein
LIHPPINLPFQDADVSGGNHLANPSIIRTSGRLFIFSIAILTGCAGGYVFILWLKDGAVATVILPGLGPVGLLRWYQIERASGILFQQVAGVGAGQIGVGG